MGSLHLPTLTAALLQSYSEAALRNADELCAEAALLRDHDHMARAYFLAVASIEEGGKALLAFDSQTRNLADPAVCKKLKNLMESHGAKINYALSMWALSCPDKSEALKVAIDLIIAVKHGVNRRCTATYAPPLIERKRLAKLSAIAQQGTVSCLRKTASRTRIAT